MHRTATLALALALGTAGCDYDPAGLELGDPIGSYSLVAADAGPLPHRFRPGAYWMEITGGGVVLLPGGRFVETLRLMTTDSDGVGHEQTVETEGTYRLDGPALALTADPAGDAHAEGSLVQGSLNYRLEGGLLLDLAFQRQK